MTQIGSKLVEKSTLKGKRARALERKLLRRLQAVVDPIAIAELESAFASCSEGDNLIPERQRRLRCGRDRYIYIAMGTCNCAVATRDR